MKYSIISSTKDIAGMNIKEKLKDKGFIESEEEKFGHKVLVNPDGVKYYTTDKETIYSEGIDTELDGERVIFATRHKSYSRKRTLSVHAPGNWAKAEAGGKDRKLCVAMPTEMKKAFLLMQEMVVDRGLEEFEVSMESTHHGPFIEKPCMFIEIGSEESIWKDAKAGELIADVIIELLKDSDPADEGKSVVVLGGGHYNMVANKLLAKTEYSVGHICPKHHLEEVDAAILRQAMEKNPGFEMFVLDWKGMGSGKQNVKAILEEIGAKSERYNRISKAIKER